MFRLAASLVLVGHVGVECFRTKRTSSPAKVKSIAGVPIYNYDKAHQGIGVQSIAGEESWILVVNKDVEDNDIEEFCGLSKKGCKARGHPRNGGAPFFEISGTEDELRSVLEAAPGAVKYVEPNQMLHKVPGIESKEMMARSSASWGLERVGVSKRDAEGKGVYIYVLDTGIRSTHSDFGGRAATALDMTRTDIECNGALMCAGDIDGHGTHCAGSAAGKTYGVAPSAFIRSAKVLDNSGSGPWTWSYTALDWIATKGERPAVASMSLGGEGRAPSMKDTIDSVTGAGVTVVVAAGNENADACGFSPAYVPSSITVGSTNLKNERSVFSNYGTCTDIWAPGTSIRSTWYTSDTASEQLSGTSMACPHVSGGAALILGKSPNLSPADVKAGLLANAAFNLITGLKTGDENAMLYVGADGPPATPPPPPQESVCGDNASGPDSLGDCACNAGYTCYEGYYAGCPYSWTSSTGGMSKEFFEASCSACSCQ